MGLFRRRDITGEVRAAVAAELAESGKALALPAGAVTTDMAALAHALSAPRGEQATLLPRTDPSVPFGPGVPIAPSSIDPRLPGSGRPAPRVSEFPVSVNLQFQRDRLIPFKTLRDVADHVDVFRRCIEVRKAELTSLEWDIVVPPSTIEKVMVESGETSPGKAARMARERFAPEISRCAEFFEMPDRLNGLGFSSWMSMLLEEMFVIDAVAIYPHHTFGGEIHSFEIIDGATIKPLRNHRGGLPQPPQPAYQQVLHGFPRGEFTASTVADGEFAGDQLLYARRVERTWTPYGYSNVEQALSVADLYLKRIGWMRSEFDDGTTPDQWIKTDKAMSSDELAAYEQAMNDLLGGSAAERHRVHLLPAGMEPVESEGFADKYDPAFDEFLIKLSCACFDVMPTELGYPPQSGIGGKGHQDGEANTVYRKAMRPTATWLMGILNTLAWHHLGMPRELAFQFIGYQVEDHESAERVWDTKTRGGRATLNEARAAQGLPLYDWPEADTPFIVTGAGIQFLPGALAAAEAAAGVAGAPTAVATDIPAVAPPDEDLGDEDADEELAKFARYVAKPRKKWRPFEFAAVPAAQAGRLNKLAAEGRIDDARHLAKAKKGTVPTATRSSLVAEHGQALAAALAAALPDVETLAAEWDAVALTKSVDARTILLRLVGSSADLAVVLEALKRAGFTAGAIAAAGLLDADPAGDDLDSTAGRTRLGALIDSIPELAASVLAAATEKVVAALASGSDPAAALDLGGWAERLADSELTDPLTQGSLATYETNAIQYVRLTASAGECTFCEGYDGRILKIGEDEGGMPPLHAYCTCDIDPLTD